MDCHRRDDRYPDCPSRVVSMHTWSEMSTWEWFVYGLALSVPITTWVYIWFGQPEELDE